MAKKLFLCSLFIFIFGFFSSHFLESSAVSPLQNNSYFKVGSPYYFLNDEIYEMDLSPLIRNSRTLVPIKYISDAIGAEIIWNYESKTTDVIFGDRILKIENNSNIILFGDDLIEMDTYPIIVNNRTLLPVSYVAKAFNLNIDWNQNTEIIKISGIFGDMENYKSETKEPIFPKKHSWVVNDVRNFDISYGSSDKVPVLMYHHILPKNLNSHKNNAAVINLEDFEKQMNYLYENGFTVLTLKEFEKFMDNEIKIPKKSVLITFDDGYQSKKIYAEPVLKKYGFTAASFLITNHISKEVQEFNHNILSYKSFSEIHDSLGVFEYGGHTHNLHRTCDKGQGIIKKLSYEEVWGDLNESRSIIDSSYFAYPYCHYNNSVINILRDLNYTMAFTTQEKYATPSNNKYEIGRFAITPFVSFDRFKRIVNP